KYQAVSDVLFRNQASWGATGKVWETVATALTPEEQKKVQALANDPAVLAEVQRDYDLGQKVHIDSTPTIIITHRLKMQPWKEWSSYPLFKSYLDELLKK